MIMKLNSDQKFSIQHIGFGSLLYLKSFDLDRKLCQWLVDRFDFLSCSLRVHGKTLKITPKDVENILGLNSSGEIISENDLTHDRTSEEHFVRLYGVKSLKMRDLRDNLFKTSSSDDEFKVKFVLYILCAFLCPTTNSKVRNGLIKLCRDVEKLKKINWGKFVLDHLVSGIQRRRNHQQNGFSGCIIFLVVSIVLYIFNLFLKIIILTNHM